MALAPNTYFLKSRFQKFPTHRDIDHRIFLKDGTQPPYVEIYDTIIEKLVTFQE